MRLTKALFNRKRKNRFRPTCEILEDRCVPAARIWTGAGVNDLWSNPQNWDGSLTAPANGDDVLIPNVSGSAEVLFDNSVFDGAVTLNSLVSNEPFRIASGRLTLDGPGTFQFDNSLTFSGAGFLHGSGTVDVHGFFNWAHGTMTGSGVTNALGGLDISGNRFLTDTRTLNNWGPAHFDGVVANFVSLSSGEVFNNLSTATFTLTGNHDIVGGTFNNQGTLIKRAGTSGDNVSHINSIFTSSGLVDVQSGTLRLDNDGTYAGDFNADAGGTLNFNDGTHTFAAGSDVTAAGRVLLSGSAATTFNPGSTFTIAGHTEITGGTHIFNITAELTTLTVSGAGFLGGPGTVNVRGFLNWAHGTMTGSGVTNALGGLAISGNRFLTDTRTLNNAAAATFNGVFSNFVQLSAGAVFNNLPTGTFTVAGNHDVIGGTFNNLGALVKQAGASGDNITGISSAFSNSGTVDLQSGTLQLQGSFANFNNTTKTLSGGTYLVAGVLRFPNANIVTNNAAIVLRGPTSQIINHNTGGNGIAAFSSNTAAASFTLQNRNLTTTAAGGVFTNVGNMTLDIGTFTVAGGGQYRQTGGATTLMDGGVTASKMDIAGGTLRGDGTVTGTLLNTGGTVTPGFSVGIISVTGNYTQASGGTLEVDIAGRSPTGSGVAGVDFDRLHVGGNVSLSGAVNISVLGPFVPVAGDTYPIIPGALGVSGAFSAVQGSQINDEGLFFDPEYTTSSFDLIVSRLDAGPDRNVDEASLFELLAPFADPGTGDGYAATIDWGDGSPVEDGTILPGKYVSGNHTYADNGVHVVTVRLTGADGSRASDTFVLTVDNAPPAANAGGPYEVLEAGAVLLSGSGSDVAGEHDPLTVTWDLDGDGIFGETGSGAGRGDEVGPNPTFNAASLDGPATVVVTLRVDDGDGGVTEDTAVIQVLNVAPTADAGGPYEVPQGGSVQLLGTGSDVAGENDPLTFNWDLDSDGIFGETGLDAARGDEVGPNPTFNAASLDGPATVVVTLRVDDGDGGIAEATATINVLPPQTTETVTTLTAEDTTYTGHAYAGTLSVTVTADGSDVSSFGTVSYTFYADAAGTTSIPRPTDAGAHYVRAFFTAEPDSGYADSQSTIVAFTIARAVPTLSITGGTFLYDGLAHPATASVTGVLGEDLGSASISYADGNGKAVSAPAEAGYYTATASFGGNENYTAGSSAATIAIVFEVHSLTDFSKVLKAGRTIPIKLQLLDANGHNVSSPNIQLTALRLQRVNADGSRTPVTLEDTGNSNRGNLFRYDAGLSAYVFNLSTKDLGPGEYEFFWLAGNDPTEHKLTFRLV